MSKIVIVYKRSWQDEEDTQYWGAYVQAMDQLLRPDHLEMVAPAINECRGDGACMYIYNPVHESIIKEKMNLCIGSMVAPADNWWLKRKVPNTPLTILHNETSLSVYADLLGSRTLWYYFDDEQFIASTSQRAIAVYLQSFEFNPQAAVWMLATGCTGPGFAWDTRVKSLGAGGSLVLDKRQWALTHQQTPVHFQAAQEPKETLKAQLGTALEKSMGQVSVDLENFVLTLSGGYDSRAALYYLQDKVKHTLSWGLGESLKDPLTDAAVAEQIAKHLHTQHQFLETDQQELGFEKIFNRFLHAGEGRIDHIQTFTDGMEMWAKVAHQGVRGVVRADEVFGWLPVQNEQDTRLSVAYNRLEDFANLQAPTFYDLPPQKFPDFYKRQEEESVHDWRDRLYQQYRVTYIQTALHELVYPYTELVNPLLMDEIVAFTHTLPPNLRTSKNLYAEIVRGLIPQIPFAQKPSIPEPEDIVKAPAVMQMIKEEIKSTEAMKILSPSMGHWAVQHMTADDAKATRVAPTWKVQMKRMLPFRLKKILRHSIMQYKADANQIAFRNYLILKSNQMLMNDSKLLQ